MIASSLKACVTRYSSVPELVCGRPSCNHLSALAAYGQTLHRRTGTSFCKDKGGAILIECLSKIVILNGSHT